MSEPKPEAKVEAPKVEAAPTKPVLPKIGDKARLRAVHGFIQHPFDLVNFDSDLSKTVVLDSWYLIQLEAGKLAVEAE